MPNKASTLITNYNVVKGFLNLELADHSVSPLIYGVTPPFQAT